MLSSLAEKLHMEHLGSVCILSKEVQTRRLVRLTESSSEAVFVTKCLVLAIRERDILQQSQGTMAIRATFWADFETDVRLAASRIYLDQVNRIGLQQLNEVDKKEAQKKKSEEALKLAGELPAEEILRRGLLEVFKRKPLKIRTTNLMQ